MLKCEPSLTRMASDAELLTAQAAFEQSELEFFDALRAQHGVHWHRHVAYDGADNSETKIARAAMKLAQAKYVRVAKRRSA